MKKIFIITNIVFGLCPVFAQKAEVFSKDGEAVQGYDVVAYFTESKPVKGKETFTYSWKDAAWYFASAHNLEIFKANPEKYAPQFGGYCAFGMANGYKATTSPDAWTIVNDKLYLNYNTEVRTMWYAKQAEYIQSANQHWPNIRESE